MLSHSLSLLINSRIHLECSWLKILNFCSFFLEFSPLIFTSILLHLIKFLFTCELMTEVFPNQTFHYSLFPYLTLFFLLAHITTWHIKLFVYCLPFPNRIALSWHYFQILEKWLAGSRSITHSFVWMNECERGEGVKQG